MIFYSSIFWVVNARSSDFNVVLRSLLFKYASSLCSSTFGLMNLQSLCKSTISHTTHQVCPYQKTTIPSWHHLSTGLPIPKNDYSIMAPPIPIRYSCLFSVRSLSTTIPSIGKQWTSGVHFPSDQSAGISCSDSTKYLKIPQFLNPFEQFDTSWYGTKTAKATE